MVRTQWYHFKLGLAGRLGNWPLANYEVGQIRRSFENTAYVNTSISGVPLSQVLEQQSLPPLQEVQAAIAAKNAKGFAMAFGRLTAECNACHAAADVGFIKVQVPTSSPFSNQVFPP